MTILAQNSFGNVSFVYAASQEKFNQRKIIKKLHTLKNQKAIAIGLNVSLGLFGVHRMYLGTDLKVPVIYAATIGGGGVLWLVDLGLLIAVKDLEPFKNNPNVFMWNTAR
ncbi:MAG: TM2 domain-containing protein [Sediminibacterium sp.]